MATVLLAGCDQQVRQIARKNKLAAAAGPEDSFNWILQRVKRHLEQGPRQSMGGGIGTDDSGDVSRFTFQDEVSGELIPPQEEGEPYRALIVIRTKTIFSYSPGAQEKGDAKKKKSEEDSALSILEDGGLAANDLLLDQQLELPFALTPDDELPDLPTSDAAKVSRRRPPEPIEDDEKKFYDLVYENGRWVLETEVETESIKRIFVYALDSQ